MQCGKFIHRKIETTNLKDRNNIKLKPRIFQYTEKMLEILGIELRQSAQKYTRFNVRSIWFIFVFICGTIASVCYPIFNAKTFHQYIQSFYVVSSMVICLTCYTSILWRKPKLINIFVSLEGNLQKSRCHNSFRLKSNFLANLI